MDEQDVELKVTDRSHNRKHGITYIDGTFSLRIAEPLDEPALEKLRRHLRDAMHQMGKETDLGATTE